VFPGVLLDSYSKAWPRCPLSNKGVKDGLRRGNMDDTAQCLSTVNHVTLSQHYQQVKSDSDSPSVSNSNHHSSSPPLLWPRCFIREEYRNTKRNYTNQFAHSPAWVAGKAEWIYPNHPHWGDIENLEVMRKAPWPGSFTIPNLRPRNEEEEEVLAWNRNGFDRKTEQEPALLMLHIFSMPTSSSRRRRALIRDLHPLNSIPERYSHLVEIKFVLGRNEVHDDMRPEEKERLDMEEREMVVEQREFGDLIRLEGLHGGENMNQGKTIEWMRWVGRVVGSHSGSCTSYILSNPNKS
jgi:hypothetical protein